MLSCSRYQHSLPEGTADPVLCVVRSLRKCHGKTCIHMCSWKCFTLLRNRHSNISDYSWQMQHSLLSMQDHGFWMGMNWSSWHEKGLVKIFFYFSGVFSSKSNLAHLVPSRAKGPVPNPGLASLRFIPGPLTIPGACSEFSEKHVYFLTVTSALHSSWSFKKISDYYNSVNEKHPNICLQRALVWVMATQHSRPNLLWIWIFLGCLRATAVCGSALPFQHLYWWR